MQDFLFTLIFICVFKERQTPEALTSGPWEVLKILAHDDMNEIV